MVLIIKEFGVRILEDSAHSHSIGSLNSMEWVFGGSLISFAKFSLYHSESLGEHPENIKKITILQEILLHVYILARLVFWFFGFGSFSDLFKLFVCLFVCLCGVFDWCLILLFLGIGSLFC